MDSFRHSGFIRVFLPDSWERFRPGYLLLQLGGSLSAVSGLHLCCGHFPGRCRLALENRFWLLPLAKPIKKTKPEYQAKSLGLSPLGRVLRAESHPWTWKIHHRSSVWQSWAWSCYRMNLWLQLFKTFLVVISLPSEVLLLFWSTVWIHVLILSWFSAGRGIVCSAEPQFCCCIAVFFYSTALSVNNIIRQLITYWKLFIYLGLRQL